MSSMSSMSSNIDLYLLVENERHKALEIPRDQFINYTFRPLKWLRFLGYAIYGAEGDIYEMEGVQPVLYESVSDVAQLKNSYLFRSPSEPHLVDVSAFKDGGTITSSTLTIGREGFRETILSRDGQRCVLTRDEDQIQACHILPHSKMDSYITAVTEARKNNVDDVIRSINDIRNGVTLNSILHAELDDGHFTFLVTPNFALNKADVPKATPFRLDGAHDLELPNDDSPRYTVHHFPGFGRMYRKWAPSGADAYFPGPTRTHPSPIILDFWYGCLAIKAWGPETFQSSAEKKTVETFYSLNSEYLPSRGSTGSGDDDGMIKRRDNRKMSRRRGHTSNPALDRAFNVMFILTKLRLKERQEQYEANKEEIEAYLRQQEREEREASIAKVNDWRQGVVDDDDGCS